MKSLAMMFAIVVALLLSTLPAVAQDPEPDIGSVLVSFNLADLEPGVTDRAAGLSLEADLKVPGTVLSFVGHVSDHGQVKFSGAGPRVTHDLGRLSIFGHYLFGHIDLGWRGDGLGSTRKRAAAWRSPLRDRVVLRIGADHDGTTLYSVVGVGLRF